MSYTKSFFVIFSLTFLLHRRLYFDASAVLGLSWFFGVWHPRSLFTGPARMETKETKEETAGENSSESKTPSDKDSTKDTDTEKILSVDRVTLEKIVLESSNGSREVLLTKNESSRKLSIKSGTGTGVLRRSKDERKEATSNVKFRVSLPEDVFTSKLSGTFRSNLFNGTHSELPVSRLGEPCAFSKPGDQRIRPIKLTKSPSIGSILTLAVEYSISHENKNKVPPKVPEKPNKPSATNTAVSDSGEFRSDAENLEPETRAEEENLRAEDHQPSSEGRDKVNVPEVKINPVESRVDEEQKERWKTHRDKDKDKDVDQEDIKIEKHAQDRLVKSQCNIEVLQQNLGTKINPSTARQYKEQLPKLRTNNALTSATNLDANIELAFDQDFLEKHNLDKRLKIEEERHLETDLETDLDYASGGERVEEEFREEAANKVGEIPYYSRKVLEVEKRWSGEFLDRHLERNSSESSKSSYVEEFGSGSSRESVLEDPGSGVIFERKHSSEFYQVDSVGRHSSEEVLEDSTASTVDSDSCFEDRIKAADADIERQNDTDDAEEDHKNESIDQWDQVTLKEEDISSWKDANAPCTQSIPRKIIGINNNVIEEDKVEEEILETSFDLPEESVNSNHSSYVIRNRSRGDGYATLIKELAMEAAGSSRVKKEEKQKKKLGLRRLLPGFFSPKDSRKDYKKKEQKEKKRHDEKHFARYQQNGNYTRSPDTMNLNEDIKRNVKLDNSLNGSIIEEKLDEIKRELFPDQGPITSTPDHFSQSDDRHILCDRARVPRSYTNDSSLSSIAPDDKWNERSMQLGISPDIRKYEQRQKREEFDQSRRFAHLERKHSLQESNHSNRPIFFQRNHGPSGRISAPPTERYLVRPKAIHPIDRPLPAIPHSRIELSNYQNYPEEEEEVDEIDEIDSYRKHVQSADNSIYVNQQPTLYENTEERSDGPGLMLKSVSAQVKITRQPIVNQNRRAPLVGRSPKHASPGSSQKSGDYGDSSCTPNSSQKSGFSPTSSKSGEYYLHSPRGSSSPNDRGFEDASVDGIYENENHSSPNKSSAASAEEHLYDVTPPSPHSNKSSPSSKQLERSTEKSPSNRSPASKNLFQQPSDVEPSEDVEKRSRISAANLPASPTPPRSSMSSRKSQPSDQILIASPKREISRESRICRPTNESRNCVLESPVPMTNSPHRVPKDSYGNQETVSTSKSTEQISSTNEIQRPEPIYGRRRQVLAPRNLAYPANRGHNIEPDDRVAWVQGQKSSPTKSLIIGSEENIQPPSLPAQKSSLNVSQERVHVIPNFTKKNPIYEASYHQQRHVKEPIYLQKVPEPIYGHKSIGTTGPLSPSKRETRQHLEAFYWQQKALDAHRKPVAPPMVSANFKQFAPKIDLPEVREAVYWQQLKKLDEEQQRRIYNQNLAEESTRNKVEGCNPGRGTNVTRQNSTRSPILESSMSAVYGDRSYWDNRLQRAKINPSGKPPLMQSQKGQNQPVLIVRPQQAIRERREVPAKPVESRDSSRLESQRSKSASPHLHRGDPERLSGPGKPHAEEEGNRGDGKPAPLPIFKRGSLIGGETAEYGSTGPKRVSFSSQSNAGADLSTGNWPTKHGPAPEPPTRRHRSEDSTSDTDSVFSHRDTNQDCVYGNPVPCSRNRETQQTSGYRGNDASSFEVEYDANRPLPPPPPPPPSMESVSLVCQGNRDTGRGSGPNETHRAPDAVSPTNRNWPSNGNENRCDAERQEEEWNPDGKGRQSNDIGGSGRGEGEPGTNELTGRRGGGGGGGSVGVGSGGSILGVGSGGGGSIGGSSGGRSSSGGGGRSRDEPRRHTLGGDHQPSLHHQQFNAGQPLHPLHPHHLPPPHGQYGTPPARHTTMDLEMGTKSRQRKSPLPRGYAPPSSAMLFDDDPGIMSEVETSSTGFHRGGKQRSSLPVVRTPSKTLERPLGLVFLQYRNETKRALLPNEITSIDTVKALFVRSFPKQLTMEYLDSPHVKVYIHDSNKDMFYELEDLRSHLRDIRDRSVLRLFESTDGVTGMPGPLGIPGGGGLPPHWEDQSYFSEPEFDSEYQHQHIHKSKTAKNSTSGSSGYYVGGSSTLPRGGPLLRAYSPAASSVVGGPNVTPTQPKNLTTPDRLHGESGYMSSPERGGGVGTGTGRYPPGPYSAGSSYEDPYYSQYSGTVTPVIDEEARIRVEHMERQLANLTGLVQKALTHAPHTGSSPRDYLQVPATRDPYARTADKSVSFEKSVSFSDEPPDMNSPKQHSPQHAADTKPPKPAIKSSTLPRMSSQERDRHKPTPPPKPAALVAGQYVYRDLALTPEMYNQLRGLQKKAKDLRQEVRNLKRMSQAQAHTVRETIRDTFITIRAMLLSGGDAAWTAGDTEKVRLSREEDLYKQEMLRLEKDLTELESTVEELRGNVINKKTRVIVSDVENMALILSKSSKTLADLKVRFPGLQEGMKGLLSSEMEKVVREEKFLKEEPERLESTLRRCKKLTSTLVTLKRLASVQEQRLPNAASVDAEETPPVTPPSGQHSKAAAPVPAERTVVGSTSVLGGGPHAHESSSAHQQRPENALDALLDELQTFSRPNSQLGQVTSSTGHQGSSTSIATDVGRTTGVTSNRAPCISDIGRKGSVDSSSGGIATAVAGLPSATNPGGGTLRRLHSYPSSSDTDTSPPIARLQVSLQEQPNLPVLPQSFIPGQKPPVPERNAELLQLASARRVPPPPPPRTSSRSPLASPTSPQLPPRNHACNIQGNATLRRPATRGSIPPKEGKPPMALPPDATAIMPAAELTTAPGTHNSSSSQSSAVLSTSNSSSCESVNSQEGLQSKRGRQEQLEQRHQELLRKQKALQEQYARLQQLQRNAAGLATVPPAPPDLLKKTGSESNLLAKMGLGMSAASSGSLTSLSVKPNVTPQELSTEIQPPRQEDFDSQANAVDTTNHSACTDVNNAQISVANSISTIGTTSATTALTTTTATSTSTTTTSKIYETDIL